MVGYPTYCPAGASSSHMNWAPNPEASKLAAPPSYPHPPHCPPSWPSPGRPFQTATSSTPSGPAHIGPRHFCPMDRNQPSLLCHAPFLPRMVENLRWEGALRPQKHIPPCLDQEPGSLLPEPQAPEGSGWSPSLEPDTGGTSHSFTSSPGKVAGCVWGHSSPVLAVMSFQGPFKASHPLQGLSLGMDVPQEPLAAGTVTLPISQIKKLRLGKLSHQPMVTEHITGAGFMEGQALCQGWDVGRGPDFVPCCAPPPSEVLQTLLHLCAPC